MLWPKNRQNGFFDPTLESFAFSSGRRLVHLDRLCRLFVSDGAEKRPEAGTSSPFLHIKHGQCEWYSSPHERSESQAPGCIISFKFKKKNHSPPKLPGQNGAQRMQLIDLMGGGARCRLSLLLCFPLRSRVSPSVLAPSASSLSPGLTYGSTLTLHD